MVRQAHHEALRQRNVPDSIELFPRTPLREGGETPIPYFFSMPQNAVTGGGTAGVLTFLRTAETPNHSPRLT